MCKVKPAAAPPPPLHATCRGCLKHACTHGYLHASVQGPLRKGCSPAIMAIVLGTGKKSQVRLASVSTAVQQKVPPYLYMCIFVCMCTHICIHIHHKGCPHDQAKDCTASMCGLCCDALWWEAVKHGDALPVCNHHRPNEKPRTTGGCLMDGYEAQVDDPVASLEEWVNGDGDKYVRADITPESAILKAVLWFDGGRSGGQDIVEWCLVVADDTGAVFGTAENPCPVQALTNASFQRCVTLKGKCAASNLERVVGPLLRIITDLGMHGIPHHRYAHSQCMHLAMNEQQWKR